MILEIKDSQKLIEVKKEFNTLFPYLKLEFFRTKHGEKEANAKADMINPELTFEKVRKIHNEGAIVIREDMLVSDLEKLFQAVFGISVQVFRKSSQSWLETSVTDDWTLKRQNEEGKELSNLIR
jgi:hypothetical protein